MKQYQFKTNINCSGCVEKISPVLNSETEITEWNVDTANPNKILTVEAENLNKDAVKELVSKAGFKVEELPEHL